MSPDNPLPPAPGLPQESPASERLESWKEIAGYLKRDVRTVQRWEKREGLPVRRHLHDKVGTVYAYKSDMDAWWKNRRPRLEKEEEAQVAWWRRPLAWRIAAPLVLLLALLVAFKFGGGRERLLGGTSPRMESLAVLPLENLSGDPEQDYFADGMTEALTTDLAKISALRVISRTSVMRYKGSNKPLSEIARELNVDAVVEGAVLRSGDRVRVTAQLIHVASDRHLWAESYERDLRDILTLQREVARAVAREIQVKLTPQQESRLTSAPLVDPKAYEAYLKGRYFWNRRTEEGYKKALEFFDQAIRADANYPQAYAGLADTYALLGSLTNQILPRSQAMPKAREAAVKALALDDTLAEAHTSLAFVKMQYDWDWAAAEKEFKRAIELNPGYATAHHWYAYYLISLGRTEEALSEIKRAQECDPLSLVISTDVGEMYYMVRQFGRSIEQYRKTIEMDPNFLPVRWVLALAYAQRKMYSQAFQELQTAFALGGRRAETVALRGYVYALSGKRAEAQKMLSELLKGSRGSRDFSAYISLVYTGLGQNDKALAWLEKAYQERHGSLILMKVDPAKDPLRGDPRFVDLLRRVGLPP